MDQNTWNGLTGKEVREKIQNIEGVVNNKVDKDGSKTLSDNNYTDDEKNKFTIVATLPLTDYIDKVYYLKQDNGSYLKGLYYHDGTKWQRVGGLL